MSMLDLDLVRGSLRLDLASFVAVLNLNLAILNFRFNLALDGKTVGYSNVSNLMRLKDQ